MITRWLALAALVLAGCGELPTAPSSTLPLGEWGSEVVHISASERQTIFFFPGAVLAVDGPIRLSDGKFDLNVSYPVCVGAPPPPGVPLPAPFPAAIHGTLRGSVLSVRVVRLPSETMFESDVVHGSSARPPLCS